MASPNYAGYVSKLRQVLIRLDKLTPENILDGQRQWKIDMVKSLIARLEAGEQSDDLEQKLDRSVPFFMSEGVYFTPLVPIGIGN